MSVSCELVCNSVFRRVVLVLSSSLDRVTVRVRMRSSHRYLQSTLTTHDARACHMHMHHITIRHDATRAHRGGERRRPARPATAMSTQSTGRPAPQPQKPRRRGSLGLGRVLGRGRQEIGQK
eukprot:scaffold18873_cov112-Isochrysis_galbana.AAC.1